jgi:two-component system NtrC family sensor kinase
MEEILIIDDSQQICSMLADYVLPELGYRSSIANTGRQGLYRLRQRLPDLILLDLQLPDISGLDLLRLIAQEGYDVPVILMTAHGSEGVAVEAFRLGARNYLIKPFTDSEAQVAIDAALRERRLNREKELLTQNLQQRVQELTVLYSIGKSVSSLLDLEELLVRIVEAGVYITRAEEGFLLLRDDDADELYLRAAKNLGEVRAQRMRMPIDDTLAGQVIRTGKAIRLDKSKQNSPFKVKTGFLVRSILQVPLNVGNTTIGVLAVDNQQGERTFSENDQYLLSALADYAAIAIENARLYHEVKTSEERYRDLFSNANDLIFTLDTHLRFLSTNNMAPNITGYSSEELLGRYVKDFTFEANWDQAERSFAELLMGQNIQPFELQILRFDKEIAYLEVNARLIDTGNQIREIHCIARNVSERRRLEEQLIHAEKLSAIGQLVAGVAHELNNPLTSVSGYTQLLLRDQKTPDIIRDDLKQIHTQADRAARIVQNLLLFAREHKAERLPTNLNEVIRSTLSLRAYQLRVDNIQVELLLDPQLPVTVADPYQLQQVMLNLINNAHHAMLDNRDGPNKLTLQTGVLNDPVEPMVYFSVRDTGPGIPEHILNRIFDPFYTTKPVGQGTGLGLSICYGIVQEHGGKIRAESDAGVGTLLTVEIPLLSPAAASHFHPMVPDIGVKHREQAQQSYDILVVDDEQPVSNLLARLIRDLGHQPYIVHSGTEALEAISKRHFDLILSDVKMPGMTGFELHQHIKQQNSVLASRLIFVTGDTMSAATQARIESSGNLSLAKPFSLDKLEAMVQELLAKPSL